MAKEGMPLTKEIKQKLYNCITGKSTYEKEKNHREIQENLQITISILMIQLLIIVMKKPIF